MIVVKYCGGLGNQMFQYALQKKLEIKYPNQIIKADVSHYLLEKEHNGFELDKMFKINLNVATKREIKRVYNGYVPGYLTSKLPYSIRKYILHNFQFKYKRIKDKIRPMKEDRIIMDSKENEFVENAIQLNDGDYYIRGLWQRTEYFDDIRDTIIKDFDFKYSLEEKDKKIIDDLTSGKCIAIHLRGGDFVNKKYDLCDKKYYENALKSMDKELPLIIFTDDIKYAKEVFKEYKIKEYVSHGTENSITDMYMLSLAKNIIISNSTFSFWGAYLSKIENQKCVCPMYATKEEKGYRPFPRRNNWIAIKNKKENR